MRRTRLLPLAALAVASLLTGCSGAPTGGTGLSTSSLPSFTGLTQGLGQGSATSFASPTSSMLGPLSSIGSGLGQAAGSTAQGVPTSLGPSLQGVR